MKKDFKVIIYLLVYYFVIVFFGMFKIYSNEFSSKDVSKVVKISPAYQECINNADIDMTEEESELIAYLKRYKASVKYYNINTQKEFVYNDSKTYYGASLIKVMDALYIYSEALKDDTLLNKTIKYTPNYQYRHSIPLKKHKVGEQLSISTVVNYDIYYSDNASHAMLVDYIGKKNLNNFMKSYGLKYIYSGSSYFSNINLNDAYIYIKSVYDFIETNPQYKKEFVNAFANDISNHVKINEALTLHKYGYSGANLHDIGIIYETNPYIIVVLTQHGNSKEDVINNISKKINTYHHTYYNKLNDRCN